MTRRPVALVAGTMTVLLAGACAAPSGGGAPSGAEAPSLPPSAGAPVESPDASSGGALASDALHGVELVDVNSTMAFTLGELAAEQPVLFEMMAIWCSNCRAQQQQVSAAHELVEFHSVSLDVDPNERPEDLADYSADQGFDWRFALADQDLASALRERFGPAVLNPPSTPMVLLFPDGTIRALEFRAYGAEELAAEITAG